MTTWFVFNGDADGLIAAHQWRLSGVQPDRVVTGVKRDIGLLGRAVAGADDAVFVADIALDANRAALQALLEQGVRVTWFDHHFPGAIPAAPHFDARIDTSSALCSSLLVDAALGGRFRAWAVTAAFGDNLAASARDAARGLGLAAPQLERLAELGELMNYNAYGETVADLHVAPEALFARLGEHADPFAFLAADAFVSDLRDALAADLAAARRLRPLRESARAAAFELPAAPWARRVQGVFANELARGRPERAHALLVPTGQGYSVSVRAPQNAPVGADALCRQFESGGGRAGAAGINRLPAAALADFIDALMQAYDSPA